MADDNSSTSSSDSSDNDFLTTLHPEVGDREALVRRKLLQNFYGKSAIADHEEQQQQQQDGAHRSSSSGSSRRRHSAKAGESGATDDLDSPAFDPVQHAVQHIRSSTTHELLETEEKLALSVRTLDSTMQTLVYENYSRFIDATDAVRSGRFRKFPCTLCNHDNVSTMFMGWLAPTYRSATLE